MGKRRQKSTQNITAHVPQQKMSPLYCILPLARGDLGTPYALCLPTDGSEAKYGNGGCDGISPYFPHMKAYFGLEFRIKYSKLPTHTQEMAKKRIQP